jgi:RND family efflux transporter MFP subunit
MKKNIGITILITSIILTIVLVSNKKEVDTVTSVSEIPLVKVSPLIQNIINARIQSQGTILPANEIIVLAEINARVDWISGKMETGSSFYKGDTLVKLDKRDYELALISAESNILNAKVNLEREQAEFDLANKEWERVGSGKASDLTLRKPQLAQAEALWAASKAAVEQAQRNLDRTVIIAPFSGRVRKKNINVGSSLFAGTTIAQIYSTDYYEVRLPISDRDMFFTGLSFDGNYIAPSNQLDVLFRLDNNNVFKGKIVRTESEKDYKTKMVVLIAKIDAKKNLETNNILAIDQFLEAEIIGIELDKSIQIPRSMVRDSYVWVVDSNKKLRKRKVDLWRYEQEKAIVKKGIIKGDYLLMSRMNTLVDGMLVDININ